MTRFAGFRAILPIAIVLSVACDPSSEGPNQHGGLRAAPVDSARIESVQATDGWRHRNTIEVDLDGDGAAERLVITADVEVGETGEPLWEDGHLWAAFVEDRDDRTLVYGAFVPNGFVEAAILIEDADGSRGILLLERTPGQLRALHIDYLESGRAQLASAAHYPLEQWLPGFATPR